MPLKHRGYGAYITCDGKEVEQYNVEEENLRIINCCIPSVAGKQFKIHWEDYTFNTPMVAELYMDGRLVYTIGNAAGTSSVCDGFRPSPGVCQPFRFTKLTLTDDDHVASHGADVVQSLGVIEVRLRRVSPGMIQKGPSRNNVPQEVGPIHERSKKGGGHYVSLGRGESCKPMSFLSVKYLDSDFWVAFRFRYRPREILQAEGIMPLHPHSVDEHPIPDERAAPILSTSTRSSKKRAPPKRPASGGIETRAQKRARAASSVQDRGTAVPLDDEDRKPAISSDDEDDEIVFLEEQVTLLQRKLERLRAEKHASRGVKQNSDLHSPGKPESCDVIDLT